MTAKQVNWKDAGMDQRKHFTQKALWRFVGEEGKKTQVQKSTLINTAYD